MYFFLWIKTKTIKIKDLEKSGGFILILEAVDKHNLSDI